MPRKFAFGTGSLYRKSKLSKKTGKKEHYGSFIIRYKDSNGKTRYEILNTQDRNQAELLFAEWLKDNKCDDPATKLGDQTVDEYYTNYINRRKRDQQAFNDIREKSLKRYCNVLRPFIEFFRNSKKHKNVTMRNLKSTHIEEYFATRLGQTRFNGLSKVKISKEGLRRDWVFIGGILRKAHRDRVIPIDITKDVVKLKVTTAVKDLPLTNQIFEVRDLIKEESVRDFITVDMSIGARFNELAHLQFSDINFDDHTMKIVPDLDNDNPLKNEESYRIIDMPKHVEDIFRRIHGARRNEPESAYVFMQTMENGSVRPFFRYPNLVYRRLTRALRRANKIRKANGQKPIPYFNVHSLRHWFISWSLMRTVNPLTEAELTKIVGHCDFTMIRKIYLHRMPGSGTAQKMRETALDEIKFEGKQGEGESKE